MLLLGRHSQRGKGIYSLKSSLLSMALDCLVPAVIVMLVLIFAIYQNQREQSAKESVIAAKGLILTLDRYLGAAQLAVEVLAAAPELEIGDFAAFHRRASELLKRLPGKNIVLRDRSGQQILNTLKPYGSALPRDPEHGALDKVFATGKSAISDIFFGPVANKYLFAVEAPVVLDGKVEYSLALAVFCDQLVGLMGRNELPAEWVVTIFDASGIIAARNRSSERYVGMSGAQPLMQAMARQASGVVEAPTLDGVMVHGGFSRSDFSAWTVAVGVPSSIANGQLYKLLGFGSLSALAILTLGIAMAGHRSKTIAVEVQSLIEPALALSRRELPGLPELRIREFRDLAERLGSAFRLLENTERQRDQAEAEWRSVERMARLKDEFVATVSHELRTPLTSIVASLELLEGLGLDRPSPTAQELLSIARANGERLNRLVNDILDVEKLEAGKIGYARKQFNVAGLVEATIEMSRSFAEKYAVGISYIADSVRDANSDPDRLAQALSNFLSNAFKFSPEGSTVIVRVEDIGGRIRVSVRDFGPGIPVEFRNRVFEKFAQADSSNARRTAGSGLGLAIAKEIVEQLGGEIGFIEPAGGGVMFYFEIPTADDFSLNVVEAA